MSGTAFVPARTARGDGAGVLIRPDGTPLTAEEIAEQEAAEARGEFDDDDDEWDEDEEDEQAARAMSASSGIADDDDDAEVVI